MSGVGVLIADGTPNESNDFESTRKRCNQCNAKVVAVVQAVVAEVGLAVVAVGLLGGIGGDAAAGDGAVPLISQEQQREAAADDGAVPLLLQERRLSKSRKSVVSKVRNSFSFMSSKNLVGKKTSTTADSTAAGTNQTVDVAM